MAIFEGENQDHGLRKNPSGMKRKIHLILNHLWSRQRGSLYILAGNTQSYAKNYDVWLIKTDTYGNKVWDKTFGGNSEDFANAVQQTSDGGYILAGYTKSYGAGFSDVWLVKTDADGNKVWDKTFGGSNSDIANSVQQTIDGGYIIAGFTQPDETTGATDILIIKTDADGNKIWDKTFGGNASDAIYAVQQASDGGYILAGYTESYGAGGYDAWLIKTDADGNAPIEPTQ